MCGLRAAAWAGKRLFGIWVDCAPHGPAASPVNRERGPAAAGRAAGAPPQWVLLGDSEVGRWH
jgi:hypothetical protein